MKKLLLFIVAAVISLSTVTFTASASTKSVGIEEKTEVLKSLDILDADEKVDYSELVSRRDFVMYIAKMLEIDPYKKVTKRYYTDLTEDDLVWNVTVGLVEKNILTVGDDNKFRPNDIITADEAACVFVKLLGANLQDYSQYLDIASRNDILKSLRGTALNKSDVISGIYNCLNTCMYTKIGNTYEGHATMEQSDEMLMSELFGLYYTEGVVNSVNTTSVDGNGGMINTVRVNDLEIPYSDGDYYEYLGSYVRAYYYGTESEQTELLSLYIQEKRNDIIEINANDFIGFNENNYNIEYETAEEKVKNIKLSQGVTLIVNGSESDSLTNSFNNFNKGTLRVIKTKSSNTYDIVVMESYYNIVVQSVNLKDDKIYGKNAEELNVDVSDYDAMIITDKDGNEKNIADIAAENILSIFESNKKLRIIISTETVSGRVSQIVVDEDHYVVIEDVKYNLDPDLIKKTDVTKWRGGEAKFYVDAFGTVADISSVSSTGASFAYVMRLWENDEDDDKVYIRLYMQTGEDKEFALSENCKIDKETAKTYEAAEYLLSRGKAEVVGQLITVKLNAQGEVKEIDTVYKNSESEYGLYTYASGTYATYSSGMFGPKILLDGNTKVFLVPSNSSEIRNKDAYRISNSGFFSAWSYYTATAYRVGDGKDVAPADVLVVPYDFVGTGSASEVLALYVVKSAETYYDDESDEVREKVILASGSKEIEYTAAEGYSPLEDNNIVPGNVVFVNTNPKNEIAGVTPIYGYKKNGTKISNPIRTNAWGNDDGNVFLGKVGKFNNGYLELVDDNGNTLITVYAANATITYVKDHSTKGIEVGSVADISSALYNNSTVAVCTMRGALYGIVVVK